MLFPLYAMFFGSGVASLILQVVWFKQLQFVVGSATAAVSLTISSFFLGLSLGARFGGRWADNVRNPLRAYAIVELVAAIAAISVTTFLNMWPSWVEPLAPLLASDSAARVPVTILIGLATLVLPTTLMGATLPFLARFAVERRDMIADRVGTLYGVNTLGAVTGAVVVGFVLIEAVGVTGSAIFAAGLYAVIAVGAFVLSRGADSDAPKPIAEESETTATSYGFLIWVFAVGGFVSIAYEVIWFRIVSTVMPKSVYAFSSMLAVYLLGLVAGSIICAKFISKNKSSLLANFARIQILIALGGVLSLAMLGKISTISIYAEKFAALFGGFLGGVIYFNTIAFVVFAVPTLFIGIAFPLASELTIKHLGVVGQQLGKLYALNTLGGVAGSLVAAFILLPMVGSQSALLILVSLSAAMGVWVLFKTELKTNSVVKREVGLGIAVIVVASLILGPGYIERQLTAYNNGEVVALSESKDAIHVVVEYTSENEKDRFVRLLVNGTSFAATRYTGLRYMAALAHLPMLLHDDPKTAVVICIGTGTTVGALTTYDSLEQIHAVDLSNAVFDLAPHFVPTNESFHTNPRVRQIVADGRHYLLSGDTPMDVLTFEPPPPDDAGVVNLYTEEFYQVAKKRMRKGGVVAQWIPMTMRRGDLSKMLVKAMFEEFDYVSLWATNSMEGIAIGSDEPLEIDVDALRKRIAEPKVQKSLDGVGLGTAEDVLAMFVAADDELKAWVADTPTVTDDRPRIEYHLKVPFGLWEPTEFTSLSNDVKPFTTGEYDLELVKRTQEAITESHWIYTTNDDEENAIRAKRALDARPDNPYFQLQANDWID